MGWRYLLGLPKLRAVAGIRGCCRRPGRTAGHRPEDMAGGGYRHPEDTVRCRRSEDTAGGCNRPEVDAAQDDWRPSWAGGCNRPEVDWTEVRYHMLENGSSR